MGLRHTKGGVKGKKALRGYWRELDALLDSGLTRREYNFEYGLLSLKVETAAVAPRRATALLAAREPHFEIWSRQAVGTCEGSLASGPPPFALCRSSTFGTGPPSF